jgi:hypothetical protein
MASEEVTLVETPVGEVSEVRHYPMGATAIPYPSLSTNQIKASLQTARADPFISLSVFIFLLDCGTPSSWIQKPQDSRFELS